MKDHMIRLKDNAYNLLYEHWLLLRKKYGDKFTISEVIETALQNSKVMEEYMYVGHVKYDK